MRPLPQEEKKIGKIFIPSLKKFFLEKL